ncbi:MAG: hypothetical protein ACR65X_10750 [Methylocystis sp.]
MTHKEKRPPAATGEALQKNNSHPFSSAIHPEIQALRARHLARRYALAPAMAAAVAKIHFGEVAQ